MSDPHNPNDYADAFRPPPRERTEAEIAVAEREFRDDMDLRVEQEAITDNVLNWERLADEPPF